MLSGEMKKVKVEDLRNSDPLSKAQRLRTNY